MRARHWSLSSPELATVVVVLAWVAVLLVLLAVVLAGSPPRGLLIAAHL